MFRQHNLCSGVKTSQSTYSSPYPLSPTPSAPQLPVYNQHVPHLRRDQPMPPKIGFRWDILSGSDSTPPYPETDNAGIGTNTADYSFKPNNDGSAAMPNSYKSVDTSSDINDTDSSVPYTNPSSLYVNFSADSEDRDLFTRDQIKVNEATPQPPLKGDRMQFVRRGQPYPVEAYAKMKDLPCDHSGGDHCTEY
nr:expressed conserved protein [Hymenolepis microstoma]CUU99136.1 hypothetical transcript [Hymenolepis microstoma]